MQWKPWKAWFLSAIIFTIQQCPIKGMAPLSNGTNRRHTISLLLTKQVILPGESTTLWTNELDLLGHSLANDHGMIATGVTIGEEDDLVEMASLCHIQKCTDADWILQNDGVVEDERNEGNMLITLQCVGRVKLQKIISQYPHLRFEVSRVEENTNVDVEKCQLVVHNIETFVRIISHSERKLRHEEMEDPDEWNYNLLERYHMAMEKVLRLVENTNYPEEDDRMRTLTATSWAAFTCVKDEELDRYRLRALDYEDLLERLKLAQYMFREKELRHQGAALKNMSQLSKTMDDLPREWEGFQ